MKITFTKTVIKDVRKLKEEQLISRVETVIGQLKSANSLAEIPSLKKLKGHPMAYRVRVGSYRLGLYIEGDNVSLVRFVKRNDLYKLFP